MPKVETIIPVKIETGYRHEEDNQFEEARQRLEKAALYLESIFNLINLSAQAFEVVGEKYLNQYLDDLTHISELGNALASSIFDSTMPYLQVEFDTKKSNQFQNEDTSEVLDLSQMTTAEGECIDLAEHLSAILKDERVPVLAGIIASELQKTHPGLIRFTVENLNKALCAEVSDEN